MILGLFDRVNFLRILLIPGFCFLLFCSFVAVYTEIRYAHTSHISTTGCMWRHGGLTEPMSAF
jgi:hypothetical protein